MFQSFPLGDKSSVNLRGNFHVENVTTFEDFLKDEGATEDAMQVDEETDEKSVQFEIKSTERKSREENGNAHKERLDTMDIDTLYPVFWSLQHSFSNPPQLFHEDHFKQFRTSLEATLTKFKEVPKVLQATDLENKGVQKSRPDEGSATTFNPKYLTSRDLFKLEVCNRL